MTLASIDIGTNTVLLLVADIDKDKKIIPVLDEQKIPRIGKDVFQTKLISSEKEKLLMDILKDYKSICNKHKAEKIIAAATNAFRIAENGNIIAEKIKNELGLDIEIISGEEEAFLSFLGASENNKTNLLIDIGGGSTEIIIGKNSEIFYKKSFQMGVVTAVEKFLLSSPPSKKELEDFYDSLNREFNFSFKIESIDRIIGIAGTPITLALMLHGINNYNESEVEGVELSSHDISKLVGKLKEYSSAEIKDQYKSVVEGREDVILAGAIILEFLLAKLNTEKITVSTKGLRHGLIKNYFKDEYSE